MAITSNGIVFYRGVSQLDNETPIIGILTGIKRPSSNPKTGPMLQTWILRQDVNPHVAAHWMRDSPICGDCPLTKLVSVSGIKIRLRRCYVKTEQGPNQVWKSWRTGGYPESTELESVCSGRSVRLGAYGDPLAIPYQTWRKLLSSADKWTGYTHSWRIGRFWPFRRIVMASCETIADQQDATIRGWRTFRTGHQTGRNEIFCPSPKITCEQCGACNGRKSKSDQRVSIVIPPHGGTALMSAWNSVSN